MTPFRICQWLLTVGLALGVFSIAWFVFSMVASDVRSWWRGQ